MTMVERVAMAIEAQFLKDSVWQLDVVEEGHGLLKEGRWLCNSDSNYSFRPIDVARAAIKAMREPTDAMIEVGAGWCVSWKPFWWFHGNGEQT